MGSWTAREPAPEHAPARGQPSRALWLVRLSAVGAVSLLAAIWLWSPAAEHSHGDLRLIDGSGDVVASSPGRAAEQAMVVEAGRFVFELADDGTEPHSFALVNAGDGGAVDEVVVGAPGAPEAAQRSVSLAPGTYTLFCTTPGHAEAGMVYEIEVR